MQIRRMTLADLGSVFEIARSQKDAPHWPLGAYEAAINPIVPIDPVGSLLRVALVALDPLSGEAVGFAIASALPPQSELETIAVAAGRQRSGVGSFLFAGIVRELKAGNVTEVLLEVRASNYPALAFYGSLGFESFGRRTRYYLDPVEDALLLRLNLA
jgi:ribosomal-protein-alanine N-acetyltransferase